MTQKRVEQVFALRLGWSTASFLMCGSGLLIPRLASGYLLWMVDHSRSTQPTLRKFQIHVTRPAAKPEYIIRLLYNKCSYMSGLAYILRVPISRSRTTGIIILPAHSTKGSIFTDTDSDSDDDRWELWPERSAEANSVERSTEKFTFIERGSGEVSDRGQDTSLCGPDGALHARPRGPWGPLTAPAGHSPPPASRRSVPPPSYISATG